MELIINHQEKQMLARVLSLLNNKELSFNQKLNTIKSRYSTITVGGKIFLSVIIKRLLAQSGSSSS